MLFDIAKRFTQSDATAQDCVQETFLTAHRKLATLQGQVHLRSWLRRVAINVALMQLRRSRRIEASWDAFSEAPDHSALMLKTPSSGDQLLERVAMRSLLRRSLAHLPESLRKIWVLHDVEGYTAKETALMLNTNPQNIRQQLHQARLRLRKIMELMLQPSPDIGL